MQDALFAELPVTVRPNASPKPKGRALPKAETEAFIPGVREFIAQATVEQAEADSERQLTARIKASMAEFGHSSGMNTQAASEVWKSVIVRAYKDSIGLDLLLTNEDEDGDDEDDRVTDPKSVQERGIRWFIEFSADFRNVCWFAGYEPDDVRRSVLLKLSGLGLVYLTTKGNWKVDHEELGRREEKGDS